MPLQCPLSRPVETRVRILGSPSFHHHGYLHCIMPPNLCGRGYSVGGGWAWLQYFARAKSNFKISFFRYFASANQNGSKLAPAGNWAITGVQVIQILSVLTVCRPGGTGDAAGWNLATAILSLYLELAYLLRVTTEA